MYRRASLTQNKQLAFILLIFEVDMVSKSSILFLQQLQQNNFKEWFTEHRDDYENAKRNIQQLMNEWELLLNQVDVIEAKKLFRINRDVRFSKDKTPYKSSFSGYYKRLGVYRRGSFYFNIEPNGNTQIGGGFYGPNKEDLLRIRKEFEASSAEIEEITSSDTFRQYFGQLRGNEVKTAPFGFSKEHPNIKWVRMKQFYAFRTFTDKEVMAPEFIHEAISTWRALLPFFNFMTDVLTTNLNGESTL